MILGQIGWGDPHPTRLTADEQYTHVSLWCLLSAPLLIGCDLTKIDPFTLSLLTNDEVLAIDQDSLGRQAALVESSSDTVTLVGPAALCAARCYQLGCFAAPPGVGQTARRWF